MARRGTGVLSCHLSDRKVLYDFQLVHYMNYDAVTYADL